MQQKLTVRLEHGTYRRLKYAAKREGVSLNKCIEALLDIHLPVGLYVDQPSTADRQAQLIRQKTVFVPLGESEWCEDTDRYQPEKSTSEPEWDRLMQKEAEEYGGFMCRELWREKFGGELPTTLEEYDKLTLSESEIRDKVNKYAMGVQ